MMVKRHASRFGEDYCFQSTHEEVEHLRSHFAIANHARGGNDNLPHAFSEGLGHRYSMIFAMNSQTTAMTAPISTAIAIIGTADDHRDRWAWEAGASEVTILGRPAGS